MNKNIDCFNYYVVFSLFPSHAGGRKSYILNEYTPNAVFGFNVEELENIWNGNNYQYDIPDNDIIKNSGIKLELNKNKIYPGNIGFGQMYIAKTAANYLTIDLLKKGESFLIREGSRVVGLGEII